MDSLCADVLAKVEEQIERTSHLIALLPAGALEWRPPMPGAWPPNLLLGHLLECLAGFCAVLFTIEPVRLAHFADLRKLPVNHPCAPDEALDRLALYREHIRQGFDLLSDGRLGQQVPTAFVTGGESVLTLLLGNLEHLINHKHQLFAYLQLLGVRVASRDLYCFRGSR